MIFDMNQIRCRFKYQVAPAKNQRIRKHGVQRKGGATAGKVEVAIMESS